MFFAMFMLLTSSVDGQDKPLKLMDGGFGAGISWIQPLATQGLSVDDGPDFRVYRFDGKPGEYWGVYSGSAARGSGTKGQILFRQDGVTVRSVIVDGKFDGYLAVDRHGWQNHFFGSPFRNEKADETFFKQVDFGPAGQAKCRKYWGQ